MDCIVKQCVCELIDGIVSSRWISCGVLRKLLVELLVFRDLLSCDLYQYSVLRGSWSRVTGTVDWWLILDFLISKW